MTYSAIEKYARELGFAAAGFCSAKVFEEQRKQVSKQPQMRERKQLLFDPVTDFPWVKSLLVLLWPYKQTAMPSDQNQVFVDNYYSASNRAYQAAKELEMRIVESGVRAKANVPYPAKAAAVRAGLGMFGDHSLLINPEYGTRVVIILIALDVDAPDTDEPLGEQSCLHCGKCTAACPTGAIQKDGMTHPERCLRNYMLEGVVVPEHMRSQMEMKLVGCDMCQRVCPMQPAHNSEQGVSFCLDDFLTTDEDCFKESVSRLASVIGRNVARPQRIRAQAALLAGNRKRMEDLCVLKEWMKSDIDAVKVHATWAFSQIENHIQGLDQRTEKR